MQNKSGTQDLCKLTRSQKLVHNYIQLSPCTNLIKATFQNSLTFQFSRLVDLLTVNQIPVDASFTTSRLNEITNRQLSDEARMIGPAERSRISAPS